MRKKVKKLAFRLGKQYIDIMGDYKKANTGGQRNERPLTEEQYNEAKAYAVSLGMPAGRIVYSDFALTGYMSGDFELLRIGTDVLPTGQRVRNPNSNISLKGVIAHEIVGHREASLKGFTQSDDLLEEAQASIRAARFAPGLDCLERTDLIKDAISRLRNGQKLLREEKHKLYINER